MNYCIKESIFKTYLRSEVFSKIMNNQMCSIYKTFIVREKIFTEMHEEKHWKKSRPDGEISSTHINFI